MSYDPKYDKKKPSEKYYQPEIHVQNEMNSYDMGYAPDGDNAFGSAAYNNTGRPNPILEELNNQKPNKPNKPRGPVILYQPVKISLAQQNAQARQAALAQSKRAAELEKKMTIEEARRIIASEEKEHEQLRLHVKSNQINESLMDEDNDNQITSTQDLSEIEDMYNAENFVCKGTNPNNNAEKNEIEQAAYLKNKELDEDDKK